MLDYLSKSYNNMVLGYPRTILGILAIVLVFFAYYAKDFRLDASADSLLLENDKALQTYREMSERYETKDFLFLTFTPYEDMFSESSLRHIKDMQGELNRLAYVDSTFSILNVPLLKITGGKLSDAVKNFKTLEGEGVDKHLARTELINSPLFKDQIISSDGKTTAILINLKPNHEYRTLQKAKNRLLLKRQSGGLTDEEAHLLKQTLVNYDAVKTGVNEENHRYIVAIRKIMDKYKEFGGVNLGGVPMITDDMITFIKNDLATFGIGVLVFLVIMLSIIFRQARWVMLPLLSCAFSGLIMIGLLGLIGWRITVISSNFISLMLILTMSMNIHLVVRFRHLLRDNPELSQRELVYEMSRRMIWPSLYTTLTTMMGFGSLVVSNIKPVIDFGWMMTLGLAVMLLTTFLLFPAILVMLEKTVRAGPGSGKVYFTPALATITYRHGGKVLLLALLFAGISLFGVTKLKVENSFINYFSKNTEIYQGLKLIDDKLGGTTPLDVLLKFDKEKEYGTTGNDGSTGEADDDLDALFGSIQTNPADTWFTSYKLDRIRAVHDYLNGLSVIGKVLSLASVLRVAEDLNEGEEFDAFELAVIYKRMPEDIKASLIDPYISIKDDEARVTARILDSLPDLRRNKLLAQINRELQSKLGLEKSEFQITGLLVLYDNMLQSLFRSQILTLGVVMLGIALMLMVLFRSVSLAVIGILPNILAASIVLGLMGLLGIPLDMMTITIAAITIGIAVDDCIHYIYRFREEYALRGDYLETMHYCHKNVGSAMFYTSVTIIIGFSILVMSNFVPTIYFGLLTTLAMFIALLAALTLLPKLILIWKPFKEPGMENAGNQAVI
ncbi:MAG: RND family transporter [Gammaproteobacteria bacterium]